MKYTRIALFFILVQWIDQIFMGLVMMFLKGSKKDMFKRNEKRVINALLEAGDHNNLVK